MAASNTTSLAWRLLAATIRATIVVNMRWLVSSVSRGGAGSMALSEPPGRFKASTRNAERGPSTRIPRDQCHDSNRKGKAGGMRSWVRWKFSRPRFFLSRFRAPACPHRTTDSAGHGYQTHSPRTPRRTSRTGAHRFSARDPCQGAGWRGSRSVGAGS